MENKEITYTLICISILVIQSASLFYSLFTLTGDCFNWDTIPTDICVMIGLAGVVTALAFAVFDYLYMKQVNRDYKMITYVFTSINLMTVSFYFASHFLF